MIHIIINSKGTKIGTTNAMPINLSISSISQRLTKLPFVVGFFFCRYQCILHARKMPVSLTATFLKYIEAISRSSAHRIPLFYYSTVLVLIIYLYTRFKHA